LRREKVSKTSVSPFIPVVIKQGDGEREEAPRIEWVLPNGHRLCVPRNFHDETLLRLWKVVESVC
jgi:hypothetical protein